MYFALHNVNVGFVARGAEGVEVVVVIVILPADLATGGREVELKSVIAALARFGSTIGESAWRASVRILERCEVTRSCCLGYWMEDGRVTYSQSTLLNLTSQ